jgi:hypothetical protein
VFGVDDAAVERLRRLDGVTAVTVEEQDQKQLLVVQTAGDRELTTDLLRHLNGATVGRISSGVPTRRACAPRRSRRRAARPVPPTPPVAARAARRPGPSGERSSVQAARAPVAARPRPPRCARSPRSVSRGDRHLPSTRSAAPSRGSPGRDSRRPHGARDGSARLRRGHRRRRGARRTGPRRPPPPMRAARRSPRAASAPRQRRWRTP